ncbi:MAG: ABC transporter permease [Candidatus Aminicenantes bacterium]|nr:ABC transporter permease [Candidatus Aminicenantes bacterium]
MLKLSECFKIGLSELKNNKIRSFLTTLGIVFGVGSVIAMLSIGEGARRETIEQIELMGTHNIIVNKKSGSEPSEDRITSFSHRLSMDDGEAIQKINPYIEYVTPQKEDLYTIIYKSKVLETRVIGTTPNYPATYNSEVQTGRFFGPHHLEGFSNVCVLGAEIKEKLFMYENPLNKEIKIGSQWFRVIGVLASKKITPSGVSKLGLRNFNMDIYLPLTTMFYKLTGNIRRGTAYYVQRSGGRSYMMMAGDESDPFSLNSLTIKVKKNAPMIEAAKLSSSVLSRRHRGSEDFEVIIPEELLKQKQKTQRIFNIVMGAMAGISLLVGGIGIMNIMLADVLERTKEIGIRRAVGATERDILYQFLSEAVIISMMGGVLGIITGFILTSIITGYAAWRMVITPISVVVAFVVSVCVGISFGIFPAKKAAEKDPAETIRYE